MYYLYSHFFLGSFLNNNTSAHDSRAYWRRPHKESDAFENAVYSGRFMEVRPTILYVVACCQMEVLSNLLQEMLGRQLLCLITSSVVLTRQGLPSCQRCYLLFVAVGPIEVVRKQKYISRE
jgi:hypothetical protein